MTPSDDVPEVAAALMDSIGLLARRLRQVRPTGDLSHPESVALSSLERNGPSTSADLARLENLRPQSMHATLGGLARLGLVTRDPDPDDGRRIVVSLTPEGRARARAKRAARGEQLRASLVDDFTDDERATLLAAAPLLERLALRL